MSESPQIKKGKTKIGETTFIWGARTYIMGVVNVTPDSFSGDGLNTDINAIRKQAQDFQEFGADIIDIGGESTRPPHLYEDSKPVSLQEELSRVIPVVQVLSQELRTPISVDTYKSEVAEAAIKAGASMINDVWGLQKDSKMSKVVSEQKIPVVLMHNQNHTRYNDLIPDIIGRLKELTSMAIDAGIEPHNIILDPGIGFGKSVEQNLEILRHLKEFKQLNQPLLLGTSRKSTIGHVLNLPIQDRLEGTAATVAISISKGADIVRVHDVKEMSRVSKMSDAIVRGWKQK
jgi:dihydropteroate synthase